ncbi:MAG: NADH-quinone oxidoreductase subunit H [Nitrososphaerota archaeon]|jgi:NADH-quinone oxidoreductase subunit H|nr:NADH-quinone oxidoreductase subunit H [Nitrososphaerota archaeon]
MQLLQLLVFPGLTFFVWIAFAFEWLERKTAARMQGRVGPMIAGPFGLLQPVADFLKLASKEQIIPKHSEKFVLTWGPPLYFAAPAIGIIFIPVIGNESIIGHPLDLLFVLFVLAFSTLMASLLGYSAAGRYSTIAVGRLVVQYTSYEIPLILSVISPAILAGNLSLGGIVSAQSNYWFILSAPIGFAVFIIASLAELEKPPFDIPSAKTEIVGGWMTDFSGNALAYVKLTKNLSYVFLSALAVTLFLGGPNGPVLFHQIILQYVMNTIYFMVKLFSVGFLIFVVKTALARIRIDQAAELFWTILTPLSLAQLGLVILLR